MDASELATVVFTAEEFGRWLASAKPGERCEYHHGFLGRDREKSSKVDDLGSAALKATGYRKVRPAASNNADVWECRDAAQVHLLQRKTGPFQYAYLAERAA